MSIIIVDDNVTNQMIIRTILTKEGYSDLRIASSARQLFGMLHLESECRAEEPVDLILLDMMMPEIDGLEACRRIQADDRYRDVPIIFVTAVGDSLKLAEALDAGATDYVMKPINKLELMARIRSALRLKYEKDWHKERDKRIRYELELAKQVQRSVLSSPIQNEQISILADYRPSFELAGDYYAWFRIDRDRYAVILLDMMGHGISSSLVCMFISSVLKDMMFRITDPEEVILELNRYMGQLYRSDELMNYYFTAVFVVIDTANHTVEYVNAGHPPGLVVTDDSLAMLNPSGPAIGLFEHIRVSKGMVSYKPGTVIALYTDGLLEAMGSDEDDALVTRIAEGIRNSPGAEPGEIVEALMQCEDGSNRQRDDICLLQITLK
ncbi:fused response regulator/phosphatase [Paenibacillus sp. 1011MAR3C5]|uniref:SpoIIE family protein phosphatase n=1 Tax=Paenibacillus sp. 1011MAR3C5 TaxID=1675787 RepID=UPI000E6C729F|nr:fused response regulator/phosphatase [Paenibacillus sp. 1011MAR3C5]RJE85103.1 fused response regulator/phosphatase [Paenibacillus sp. 1011MAR3C5]